MRRRTRPRRTSDLNLATAENPVRIDHDMLTTGLQGNAGARIEHQTGPGLDMNVLASLNHQCFIDSVCSCFRRSANSHWP